MVAFQVQINASLVLVNLRERSYLGSEYVSIIRILIESLDRTQSNEDQGETTHKLGLIDSLCLAISNLVTLGSKDDLLALSRSIQPDEVASLSFHFASSKRRVSPERATLFLEASRHLEKLVESQSGATELENLSDFISGEQP